MIKITAAVSAISFSLAITSATGSSNNVDFLHGNNPKDVASKSPHVSSAGRCPPVDVEKLEAQELLHSQDGQDRCLMTQYFPGLCGGRYMEVGALDGSRFSNTYAFYASPDLGWKGINVEVDPVSYENLSINRKNDIANVNAAVCSDPQVIHYAQGKFKAVGGIWEFSSKEQRERWWPGMTLADTTPVECTHLQNIVDQTLGESSFIDFMTLDIEGAELSALQGLDFSKVGFGVIVIESQEGRVPDGKQIDGEIEKLLKEVGYDRARSNKGGGRNLWFENRSFDKIYAGYKPKGGAKQEKKQGLLRGN